MLRHRLKRPAREVALLIILYAAYSGVRNLLGNDRGLAERNAHRVIDLERHLGLFQEVRVQGWLLHNGIMQTLNAFYGLAHFVVTASVLVWLYHFRHSYKRWRTLLMVTTGLALVGYFTFPLMPPRLAITDVIVDTTDRFGSPWNYDQGAIAKLSNQYAAMPSLHVAWALWCTFALWHEVVGKRRHRWTLRVVAVAYSCTAVVTVIATGNHYVLDVLGGAAVLGLAVPITALIRKRRDRDAGDAGDVGGVSDVGASAGSEAVVPAVDRDDVAGVVAAGTTGQVDGEAAEVGR